MTDDRRHCKTCANLKGDTCTATRFRVMDNFPRRCRTYAPHKNNPDQRQGAALWPWIFYPEQNDGTDQGSMEKLYQPPQRARQGAQATRPRSRNSRR